jgi:3-hydroxy-9,10-secoandrosta-1,3,5(10)-triene-9,17-dione monooxygenase
MSQIERNIEDLLGYAERGEKIPMPLRVRVRRDQVSATGAGIQAVDRLFESAGGRALRSGTPIQRFWRDAHAGRVHAINDPEKALVLFGQFELGIKVQDAWL